MDAKFKVQEGMRVLITKPGEYYRKTGVIFSHSSDLHNTPYYSISLDEKEYDHSRGEDYEVRPSFYKKDFELILSVTVPK